MRYTLSVKGDEFTRPCEFISDTLTGGLPCGPEFKVFDSVVISDPIQMVHIFVFYQPSA